MRFGHPEEGISGLLSHPPALAVILLGVPPQTPAPSTSLRTGAGGAPPLETPRGTVSCEKLTRRVELGSARQAVDLAHRSHGRDSWNELGRALHQRDLGGLAQLRFGRLQGLLHRGEGLESATSDRVEIFDSSEIDL